MNEPAEIIHLGITGHRFIKNSKNLTGSLEKACQFLEASYPLAKFEVYSGLAEGADRLAAKVLLEHQALLTAVLPLPVEEYQKDFTTKDSIYELQDLLHKAGKIINLPKTSNHSQAYGALGDFLVQNSNILISFWDGNPSTSPGSTGIISSSAIKQKMPVIWIHTENWNPQKKHVSNPELEQGRIEYLNF